jgi:Flp pilus assembly protein TadG
MSSHILGVFRSRPLRANTAQRMRRFGNHQRGATAVEFAIVVFPFLALLFAIIEIALVFFASQVLETATADSARRIMTGEVQNEKMSYADFKNDLCGRIHGLFDCQTGVKIDVQKYSSFGTANVSPPLDQDGNLDASKFGFDPGVQGDIVVVRVAYEWPVFVRKFGLDMASLPNGKRLLLATAAFRNEPYKAAN